MGISITSSDSDNKTLNLYQDFIVSKTPIHYLSLVQNAENKTKEEIKFQEAKWLTEAR